MIHYTLLPEKEIESLKKEYRTRLFIVTSFFVSFGILAGLVSLIPSYVFSYSKEKEAVKNLQALQDSRRERGTDIVMTELNEAQSLISDLEGHKYNADFSRVITEIILRKNNQISLTSFQISQASATSSSLAIVVQGRSLTRDSLLSFKKNLEQNPLISKIDLPPSDLAKKENISFALTFTIQIR
jgi:hypothetical protein